MQRTPQRLHTNRTPRGADPADWDRQLIEEQLALYSRSAREPDPLGKLALFSAGARTQGKLGTLTLECSWLANIKEQEFTKVTLMGTQAGAEWPELTIHGELAGSTTDIKLSYPDDRVGGHQKEIAAFARGLVDGSFSEGQIAALAMAILVARKTQSAAAGMLTGTAVVTVLAWLVQL